jgi:galactose oxidase
MRSHRLAALVAAAAMATASALAAASPAYASTYGFEIQNAETGWCLQPAGGSSAPGALVVQATCNGSLAQRWATAPASSGVHLVNLSTGLCLDARGGADSGTPIEQWTCDWISNENWKTPLGYLGSGVSGTYTYCVTPVQEFLGLSTSVALQPCLGWADQVWYRYLP